MSQISIFTYGLAIVYSVSMFKFISNHTIKYNWSCLCGNTQFKKTLPVGLGMFVAPATIGAAWAEGRDEAIKSDNWNLLLS